MLQSVALGFSQSQRHWGRATNSTQNVRRRECSAQYGSCVRNGFANFCKQARPFLPFYYLQIAKVPSGPLSESAGKKKPRLRHHVLIFHHDHFTTENKSCLKLSCKVYIQYCICTHIRRGCFSFLSTARLFKTGVPQSLLFVKLNVID